MTNQSVLIVSKIFSLQPMCQCVRFIFNLLYQQAIYSIDTTKILQCAKFCPGQLPRLQPLHQQLQALPHGKVDYYVQARARHHQSEGRVLHTLPPQASKTLGQCCHIVFIFGTELLTWPDFVFMLVSFCLSEETSVQLFETWSDKQENHNFLQSRCIYVYK